MYATDEYRREEFFAVVLNELRLRHVPIDRRQFNEFVESMKALWFEGDSPQWWADTFVEAHQEAA